MILVWIENDARLPDIKGEIRDMNDMGLLRSFKSARGRDNSDLSAPNLIEHPPEFEIGFGVLKILACLARREMRRKLGDADIHTAVHAINNWLGR